MLRQEDIFESGRDGYHTYRIPATVVSVEGTILAFCEGRMYGDGDAGKIDILLRRSRDGGTTWDSIRLVCADDGKTCGNPCPVVDQSDGSIWLLFCKNLGEGGERTIIEGKAPRTVWVTRSTNDGQTWSEAVEITGQVKDPRWTWYATGPCHGIQLASGRLLMPCVHVPGVYSRDTHVRYSAHVVYSDDHGETWKIGGVVARDVDECTVVETAGGAVYINCRNGRGNLRGTAWSWDQGESFSDFTWSPRLVEPPCQASLVRYTDPRTHDRGRILFSNPASTKRERLTVWVSYDESRSWTVFKVLNQGYSAYSDLCIAPDMTICCLYERGERHPYEKLTFAQFDLEWLTDGKDSLDRTAFACG